MEILLTIPQVAERLHMARSTVYELVLSGQLPSLTIGRSRRIREADLDAWIQGEAAAQRVPA